jgi:hypothetical protein
MSWTKTWKADVKALNNEVRTIKARLNDNWVLYQDPKRVRTYKSKWDAKGQLVPGGCTLTRPLYPSDDQIRLLVLRYQLTVLYHYRNHKHPEPVLPEDCWLNHHPVDLTKYDQLKAQDQTSWADKMTKAITNLMATKYDSRLGCFISAPPDADCEDPDYGF